LTITLFRRLARLARAQHDAGELVVQVFAHPARHFQPCVFALHHHIEEHQRDIARAPALPWLRRRCRHGQTQRTAIQTEAAQGQLGDVVDVGFIVDQQNFPWR
jgi:hypothetical protein